MRCELIFRIPDRGTFVAANATPHGHVRSTLRHMPDVSAFLSARAAAELAGVDERTVRRWVKAGTLAADKRGGRFLIPRSALAPFIGHSDGQSDGHERADAAERTERTADAVLVNLELVRLVDRLQQENRDLAGLVGQLQERVAVLAALPGSTPSKIAHTSDSDALAAKPTQTPSDTKRAWWRFWQ